MKPRIVMSVLVLAASVTAVSASAGAAAGAVDPDSAAPAVTQAYCGNDIWAVSATPASGFDPLTANADELEANEYPPRPAGSDASRYAEWAKLVTEPGVTQSSCGSVRVAPWTHSEDAGPQFAQPATGQAAPLGLDGTSVSQNWAGYVARLGDYTDAEAEWTLPYANGVTGTLDYSSSWVGVGLGENSSYPLIQAGSESDYLDGGTRYYLFFQVFPESQQQFLVDESQLAPGDLVGSHVTNTGSAGLFHVWDTTSGFNQYYRYGGSFLNDNHAEWIYERSAYNGKYPYLADAPPSFTEAQAKLGAAFHPLGAFHYVKLNMDNCPETEQLAHPGGLAGGGYNFTAYYDHHGDSGVCG